MLAEKTLSLGNQFLHHMSMNISQTVVSPLEAIGQLLMIKTKEVHPGGLEVVHMDRILGYTKAQIIRLCMFPQQFTHPAFDAF